ncbi:hypothetical protein CH373_04165 [Leptospira perolatii]|uniref:Iron-containing redox enzyme family protein n=1 Tax=Leptospira perolatii TaxID=2023191 RepID=A0A2M9ZQ02_9LEPT|nr:iron-containing redox enzyme family protein [Leptospira perolatii]PJZ69007.1 hypothetical protein CH360_13165 [Leptospira perolatii]PJZ74124.1 hypothetical protein CH373_04165 [Leptospira perolatii]
MKGIIPFREELTLQVQNHSVLEQNPWLREKARRMEREDLILWLKQEYFVSVSFVNWFLQTAAIADSVASKIVLVQNIWEELGEGSEENSHVFILKKFLMQMGEVVSEDDLLPETASYLKLMNETTTTDFYAALGALGPANEYLLKLEYGRMYRSFKELKSRVVLPEGKFFEVNLEADESHSEKMFRLIEVAATTEEQRESVRRGNLAALDARLVFYQGLLRLSGSNCFQEIHS